MSLYIVWFLLTWFSNLKREPQGQFKKRVYLQKVREREIERGGACPWLCWGRIRALLSFVPFFHGEATETLGGSGAFWFITWCLTPWPFFLANRFLAWAQPLSHGILSSLLSDWNKGKTWFSNWPFRFDKLFKLCLKWSSTLQEASKVRALVVSESRNKK